LYLFNEIFPKYLKNVNLVKLPSFMKDSAWISSIFPNAFADFCVFFRVAVLESSRTAAVDSRFFHRF